MELFATTYLLLFFTLFWVFIYLGYLIEQKINAGKLGSVRLVVMIPRVAHHGLHKNETSEIQLSSELYKRLSEFNIPFTLETAVHGVGEEIHFYIIVPAYAVKKTGRLIESLWPTGHVARDAEYDLWLAETPAQNGHIAMGYLSLAKPFCMPLKTAFKGHFEPFMGILRWFSGLKTIGEGAALQWVVRRADSRLLADIGSHLQKFENGEYHPSRHVHENFILTPETIKALKAKVSAPLFAVNCRLITASIAGKGKNLLQGLMEHVEHGQSSATNHNSFMMHQAKHEEKFLDSFFACKFDPAQEMILTADELATYFHFPGGTTALPKIRR